MPPRAAQGQNATLRIGTLGIEPAAQAYYAKDMGFFAKAGIDVDVQTLTAGTVSALISYAIDVAYTAVDTLPLLRQKDIPVVVTAPAAPRSAGSIARLSTLMVPLKLDRAHLGQSHLNGKVVAVSVLHDRISEDSRAGVDRSRTRGDQHGDGERFVEVPFPAMSAAPKATRIRCSTGSRAVHQRSEKERPRLTYVV